VRRKRDDRPSFPRRKIWPSGARFSLATCHKSEFCFERRGHGTENLRRSSDEISQRFNQQCSGPASRSGPRQFELPPKTTGRRLRRLIIHALTLPLTKDLHTDDPGDIANKRANSIRREGIRLASIRDKTALVVSDDQRHNLRTPRAERSVIQCAPAPSGWLSMNHCIRRLNPGRRLYDLRLQRLHANSGIRPTIERIFRKCSRPFGRCSTS